MRERGSLPAIAASRRGPGARSNRQESVGTQDRPPPDAGSLALRADLPFLFPPGQIRFALFSPAGKRIFCPELLMFLGVADIRFPNTRTPPPAAERRIPIVPVKPNSRGCKKL